MKKYVFIITIFIAYAFTEQFSNLNKSQEKYEKEAMKLSKSETKNLSLFGIIMDQDKQPIPKVEIIYHVTKFSLIPPFYSTVIAKKTNSDQNGCFELHDSCHSLYVKDIIKSGYIYELSKTEKFDIQNNDIKIPDKNNPFIFYMRKKSNPGFVIKNELGIVFTVSQERKIDKCDILTYMRKRNSHDYNILSKNILDFSEEKVVLEIKHENADDVSNTATISTPDNEFILSDTQLYNAPKEGYIKEKSLTLNFGNFDRYIYIKCKGGKYYIFGKCSIYSDRPYNPPAPAKPEPSDLRLSFWEFYLSPESSGNFEYDPEYTKAELKKRKEKNKK